MARGRKAGIRIAENLRNQGLYAAMALGEAVAKIYSDLGRQDPIREGKIRGEWLEIFSMAFENAVVHHGHKECSIMIREKK